jgi:hypothetical protein
VRKCLARTTIAVGIALGWFIAIILIQRAGDAFGHSGITFYLWTGNRTTSGLWPDVGQMACTRAYPLGTVIEFSNGWQFTCTDRGLLDENGVLFDLFAWSHGDGHWMIAQIGNPYNHRIIRWGW